MISTAASFTQVIWGAGALLVFIVTLVWGGAKFYFRIVSQLKNIENYTYKRNGGGSLMDSLLRIEASNERQDKAIEENTKLTFETVKALYKLEGRFDNHLEEGE
jgi:hypothetical protein